MATASWNSYALTVPASDPVVQTPASFASVSVADATVLESGPGHVTVTLSQPLIEPTAWPLYAQAQHIVLSQAVVVPQYINLLVYVVKPWVHGLTRTSAYFDIMAKDFDWSKVTIGAH